MAGVLGAIGGLIGGKGGVLGAAGNVLKSATSMPFDIAGMAIGMKKKKEADRMDAGAYNPLQVDLLESVKQKKKQLETFGNVPGMQAIEQQGAQALAAAKNIGGGDVGMQLNALKAINRSTGRNMNDMIMTTSNEGMQLNSLLSNMVQNMANRQYQISMSDKLQKLAEGTQLMKDSGENLRSGMALGLDKLSVGDVNKSAGGLANMPQMSAMPQISQLPSLSQIPETLSGYRNEGIGAMADYNIFGSGAGVSGSGIPEQGRYAWKKGKAR